MRIPQGPSQRWSVDFAHDTLIDGRHFPVFAVVEDFTRERLSLVADALLSGVHVARERTAIIERRGRPC